eukprot:5231005-Pleurochrysis_carterae.AAC.1
MHIGKTQHGILRISIRHLLHKTLDVSSVVLIPCVPAICRVAVARSSWSYEELAEGEGRAEARARRNAGPAGLAIATRSARRG